MVCGHGFVTLSLTINEILKWATHLNAGHSGGDSVAIGIYPLPLPPPPYPLPSIFAVPNKPYGFCAPCLLTYLGHQMDRRRQQTSAILRKLAKENKLHTVTPAQSDLNWTDS